MMAQATDLNAVIDAWRTREFVYGSADCCQFVGECVLALTGVDHREAFPAYSSESEAAALIAAYGGMTQLVASAFGDPVHPSRAHIGDPVVFEYGGREVSGICIGVNVVAPSEAGGLIFAPMAQAVAAWRL